MDWKSRSVLVTGGAGFIGSSLVKRLVNAGAQVQVVDNLWRGDIENLKGEHGESVISLQTSFCKADLADLATARRVIAGVDWVFHLADIVAGVDFVFSNEGFVFNQNVLINSSTLGAVLAAAVPNYVYVGTACSYPRDLQMVEGIAALREEQAYPAAPESAYGWSKLMGEFEAELALKSGRLNVGLLRLHNVYGPGGSFEPGRSQVLPSLVRKAIMYPREQFIVWGTGSQYRDFVYIDDVVEALLLVAERGMNKGVIQIGSERAVTIREAAQCIAALSGKGITPIFDCSKPEGDRGRIAVCDRARQLLKWQPQVTFVEGIRRTYNWMSGKLPMAGNP
jgi:GDP-D-mannose 3', 5'-epimerase